jgi:hypothetical protein
MHTKENDMSRPETLFEAASYDLIKFRERRLAERRASQRDTPERRVARTGTAPPEEGWGGAEAPARKPEPPAV